MTLRTQYDADTGPNNLQNFPVLTVATTGGSQIIAGSLSSAADTTYTLQFFNLDKPDSSGYGQGDQYLTSNVVTTNGSGVAPFDVPLPDGVAAGTYISATATEPIRSTIPRSFPRRSSSNRTPTATASATQTEAADPTAATATTTAFPTARNRTSLHSRTP